MNKWMNGWMNKWMNEWMGEWMNEWMNELPLVIIQYSLILQNAYIIWELTILIYMFEK